MKNLSIKYFVKAKSYLDNEQGAQTLEWVAIGAVVVSIAALLGSAFDGDSISGIVDDIIDKISKSL